MVLEVSTRNFGTCKIIVSAWTGSSMVEQLTLNQRVGGSSPPRFTNPKTYIHKELIKFHGHFFAFRVSRGVAGNVAGGRPV